MLMEDEIKAPLCRCLKCSTTAPQRAVGLRQAGAAIPGFVAPSPWRVTQADRPTGWTAWPDRVADLSVGLCATCTEAKRAAERQFLIDKNEEGLTPEELKARMQALGFEVRELPREEAALAPIVPVVEGPRATTAPGARVLPPEVTAEARRKNTIPQVATPAWKEPMRVTGVPQPTRAMPSASDPVKREIAPQPNLVVESSAARTVVKPTIEPIAASTIAVEKIAAPIRTPAVAPAIRAEAVGARTALAVASPVVDQGKKNLADAPKRTQMVAAPTMQPNRVEATRMAPIPVHTKVAGIPAPAKAHTPTAQPLLAVQTPIRSCIQVRRNAPAEVAEETVEATEPSPLVTEGVREGLDELRALVDGMTARGPEDEKALI